MSFSDFVSVCVCFCWEVIFSSIKWKNSHTLPNTLILYLSLYPPLSLFLSFSISVSLYPGIPSRSLYLPPCLSLSLSLCIPTITDNKNCLSLKIHLNSPQKSHHICNHHTQPMFSVYKVNFLSKQFLMGLECRLYQNLNNSFVFGRLLFFTTTL